MSSRRSPAVIALVLVAPVFLGGTRQGTSDATARGLRTLHGRIAADDLGATPLRRVRIVLTARGAASNPAYTDEQGQFAIAVPRSAYVLTLTKAGFASRRVPSSAIGDRTYVSLGLEIGAAINGRVVDQYGDPLLAHVKVERLDADRQPRDGAADRGVDTDDLGEFRVGSLPAGAYRVTARAAAPAASPPGAGAASALLLQPGQEADLMLTADARPADPRGASIGGSRAPFVVNGAIIRGRVVTVDSKPVAGAFIALFAGVERARVTSSRADGTYSFAELPAGVYRVSVTKIGASLEPVDRDVVATVRDGEVAEGVDVAMRKSPAITGTVRDEFGDPIEGIEVAILDPHHGPGPPVLERRRDVRTVRTDDRGAYRLFPVVPGEHYVTATEATGGSDDASPNSLPIFYPGTPSVADATTVRVAAGQDARGIDIAYAPPDGATIYGYAFDSRGAPLTVPVALVERIEGSRPVSRREARVAASGAFSFANVPPGMYVLQGVFRPTPGRQPEAGFEFVAVAGSDVPPVTLRTAPGTTVHGHVEFEGDTSAVAPESFAVGASPADLDYLPRGVDVPGAGVGEDATFELHLQGPMRMTARAAPRGWWLKSAVIGVVNAAEEPYTFAPRSDTDIDMRVVFSDAAAEVAGQVVDARGRPVPNAQVLAFPTDESRWFVATEFVRSAMSGGDGRFGPIAVAPGDYWIIAIDRNDVAPGIQDPDMLRSLVPGAQRLTLVERQSAVRDLRVVVR